GPGRAHRLLPAALRSHDQPLRPDLRDARRQGRGGVGHRRARSVGLITATGSDHRREGPGPPRASRRPPPAGGPPSHPRHPWPASPPPPPPPTPPPHPPPPPPPPP